MLVLRHAFFVLPHIKDTLNTPLIYDKISKIFTIK